MKILYLYSELVGYQIPIFEEYTKRYGAFVHVVSWDKNKLKPYTPPILDNVIYYKRSEYTKEGLKILAATIDPDIIYISGWMDRGYLAVVKKFIKIGVPVVTGFDDQWKGNLRQRIASFLFPFIRKNYFSHAWVTGPYQYEYARRFGFKNNEIIFNLLSCNTQLFNRGIQNLKTKAEDYPKTFLYVGNFRHVKGTDILVEAFKEYQQKYNGNWKLICVGNGEMQSLLESVQDVEIIGFTSQNELVEITKRAGAFILPSRSEQWGVVVHEFAAAAMPLILSENVGAKPEFFIENYNGLSYADNSPTNLAKKMFIMSTKDSTELVEMSKNSCLLSQKITPQISAASFLSLVLNATR
jgi:glycosyltransferase involved in cell wall biosynthesis